LFNSPLSFGLFPSSFCPKKKEGTPFAFPFPSSKFHSIINPRLQLSLAFALELMGLTLGVTRFGPLAQPRWGGPTIECRCLDHTNLLCIVSILSNVSEETCQMLYYFYIKG
ncbi:hypothetical protein LINGRAHAP2_LOCUS21635, partial [Linum grandiflorum]